MLSERLSSITSQYFKKGIKMESLGFIFGMMGMSMGVIGFIFAIMSKTQIDKLETKLKELNLLEQDYDSNKK
jgi:hypothetical protein